MAWASAFKLLGIVPSPLDLYRQVDALLLTSRIEGLPLAVLEALAVGKPVIASRVGLIPSVVRDGDTGWTYAAGNLDELVRAARQVVMLEKSARDAMGKQGRAVVLAGHSAVRCVREYGETFRQVLSRHSAKS